MKKVIIFAPFWQQPSHVGNYRVDRFVRWLVANGFYIVMVRAGSISAERLTPWGVEITVSDPLGLYRDKATDTKPTQTRKPNKFRRKLVYWLFNPDPGILWARKAAKDRSVLEHTGGASFVLSSSPPESAHVGAAILAKKINAELVIDMRDGWLDEPLKPLLRTSRLQRWREGRYENAVLRKARVIFVTSPVWQTLLSERLPFTRDRTAVLTNGYPPDGLFNVESTRKRTAKEPLRLVHAGRFTGSRLSQRVSYLLEPLLLGLNNDGTCGFVTLLGKLESADLDEVARLQPRFESKGWVVEVKDAVSRGEMMNLLRDADGLLLLSASLPVIPSKLFEYLPLGKPVFAATLQSSAVWEVGKAIDQLFLIDYRQPDELVSRSFVSECSREQGDYSVPEQFTEKALSKIFCSEVIEK